MVRLLKKGNSYSRQKLFLLIVIINLLGPALLGQVGFNKVYDFGYGASGFLSMLIKNDTLVIAGLVIKDSFPYQQGILVAKADTNGTILDIQTHFLTEDQDYFFGPNTGFIEKENGHYALVGNISPGPKSFLAEFDQQGQLIDRREYVDSLAVSSRTNQLINTGSNIFLGGWRRVNDRDREYTIRKLDQENESIWFKAFGTSDYNELLNSFTLSSNGNVALGTSFFASSFIEPAVGKILIMDHDGNFLESWDSSEFETGMGVSNLTQTNNSGWLYSSVVETPQGNLRRSLIRINESFEFLWEITTSELYVNGNQVHHLDKVDASRKEWISVGSEIDVIEGEPVRYAGICTKFNDQGEILWHRKDTALGSSIYPSDNQLNSFVTLPSGSIIACGFTEKYIPQGTNKAWLYKLDKNGCNTEEDCIISTTLEIEQYLSPNFEVFPNPMNTEFTIQASEKYSLMIYDSVGKRYLQVPDIQVQEYLIQVKEWPSGLYILHFQFDNRQAFRKVIKN